jgi:hypothetical protein
MGSYNHQAASHAMPSDSARAVDRWPETDAGSQFGHGPKCFGFAAVNTAIAGGIPGALLVDPVEVFRRAAAADSLTPEINRRLGTTGNAAMEAACGFLPQTDWMSLAPGNVRYWVCNIGPVMVMMRWFYRKVGAIGMTARREELVDPRSHALCLCGFDPKHKVGLGFTGWRYGPCYLVKDSVRRDPYYIEAGHVESSGDLGGAWVFVPRTKGGQA